MYQKWIDNAKGIAMILVIIGHSSAGLTGIWNFQFVYGIHLVIFFLISGYTSKKKDNIKEYVNDKFARLMTPYFYTCIAILVTDVFNSWCLDNDITIKTVTQIMARDLVRSFFASGASTKIVTIETGSRIGAIWFLPGILFALIIFQIFLNITQDDKKLCLYTGCTALIGYVTARFFWLPFSVQSGMMASFFLYLGYEAKRKRILEDLKWYHFVLAQFIFLINVFGNYSSIGFVGANINDIIISLVGGISGVLLVYLISVSLKNSRILPFIGRISLTVLCAHLYILETMGRYINKLLDIFRLEGNRRVFVLIAIEIVLAVGLAAIIEATKKGYITFKEKRITKAAMIENAAVASNRNAAIDITKGILILSIIIGNFQIDGTLRMIIYSCHMIAFIFFSGIFYKENRNVLQTISRMIRTFIIPYICCAVCFLLLHYEEWSGAFLLRTIKQYVLGMSLSNRILNGVESVGPIYFILLLFIIRIIYMVIDYFFKKTIYKYLVVLAVSVFGVYIGQKGFWLPWSVDVACYGVIFYQIGILAKKENLLSEIGKNHIWYFVLTPIWVYMIYCGSMEIAVRNYGSYGLVVIGSVAGTLSVYKLAVYIMNHLPITSKFLCFMGGEASLYMLIIHVLLNEYIGDFLSKWFNNACVMHMFLSIVIQILITILVRVIMKYIHNRRIKLLSN